MDCTRCENKVGKLDYVVETLDYMKKCQLVYISMMELCEYEIEGNAGAACGAMIITDVYLSEPLLALGSQEIAHPGV